MLPGTYEIKKPWKPCCSDFKITMDYKHITKCGIGTTTYRFSGHVIHYCPYCGEKLEVEK